MIVKNERHVLERCLRSARPLVDAWAIADTGSDDGTQDFIRDYLADLPGELIERPWVDFAHNRNEAIALAAGRAHYLLFVDADEEFELVADTAGRRFLCADKCDIAVKSGTVRYGKTTLVRNDGRWRFLGAVHEYVDCPEPHTAEFLPWLCVIRRQEGARSLDPLTAYRDAVGLEGALLREPDSSRHMFYLAQSYNGAGLLRVAIDRYRRRVAMGGWPEETWCARYQIARAQARCGDAWPVVMASYLEAYGASPGRPEPLFWAGLHYRELGQYDAAMMFYSQAMAIPTPWPGALFVDWDICIYWLPMEFAVCCFHLGDQQLAIATYDRLLADAELPEDRRTRILRNRALSVQALDGRVQESAESVVGDVVTAS